MNFLGIRNKEVYGNRDYNYLLEMIEKKAKELGVDVECFQSNHEGAIVDKIHEARNNVDYIIINAGALTHTSVAIRDALIGVAIPFVEVHISNVHARESFRHHSYLSDKAVGVIVGLGTYGYESALRFCAQQS